MTASRAADLIVKIDLLHAGISARQREMLRHLVEFDVSGRWRVDGCRDMAQWLSGRLGISNWDAQRWVNAAHALEHLPMVSQALESGVLCLDKVVELSRFATPETEKKLISWARRVSAAAIRRKGDLASRVAIEDIRDAERSRFLRWWWFDDGKRLGLEGEFPAAQGAAITKALKRLADQLPVLPREDEWHELATTSDALLQERCADALFAMASRTISDDCDADRATVVVHTTLGSACCTDAGSEFEGGPVLHPDVARRLACDARLQFVLTDREGNALGIGQASRNVPLWLMRELRARDFGCTFPGCGARSFLEAHHIWHWDDGGPTDLDNLVLTCHFHHKLVHEFGWSVRLSGSTAEWFRPNGRRFDPGPDPPSIDRDAVLSPIWEKEQLAIAV
jgi:hypothetical protein